MRAERGDPPWDCPGTTRCRTEGGGGGGLMQRPVSVPASPFHVPQVPSLAEALQRLADLGGDELVPGLTRIAHAHYTDRRRPQGSPEALQRATTALAAALRREARARDVPQLASSLAVLGARVCPRASRPSASAPPAHAPRRGTDGGGADHGTKPPPPSAVLQGPLPSHRAEGALFAPALSGWAGRSTKPAQSY